MSRPAKTTRTLAIAFAAALVGVVGGLLLAARVPLWPTARPPLLEPWDGYWRQGVDGSLEGFVANLECAALPGHRLQRATLASPDSLSCRYEPDEGQAGDAVLVELVRSPQQAAALLHAAYPGRVSTVAARVSLADGTATGQRSTVRSTSAATPGLDAVVVRGEHVTVEVTCLDFQGGVDVVTCHPAQAAFFASWKGGPGGERRAR